ncbi:hypothetical protein SPRG_00564 [Saprolegnia parasitica CBS 223.65]|uniref:Peptidase S1 domain-containing protein n=1 Tax=Saprolegnia parasitica (strain CBS 223.65) TaxID=695850 RepID=A0A067D737_SAPPC|nr:hypothetical protein SPRG_00564 [Saprolegnia parasitica CBS 223.65]KDO34501.1 hypothetical protein SPRG_00564 [Saprolegnia parasitica CBS 223.65]|eukprot:XP_012194180.1 hypothetical protein SPRG_00564 [Saprolegnia parasitica CBS 223.65]
MTAMVAAQLETDGGGFNNRLCGIDINTLLPYGPDTPTAAVCAFRNSTTRDLYTHTRAAARVRNSGNRLCGAWLWGSQGHVVTSSSCVGRGQSALTVDLNAESQTCIDDTTVACNGQTRLQHPPRLLHVNRTIGYALLQLHPADARIIVPLYGYLQATLTVAAGAPIYVAGQSSNSCKRLLTKNTQAESLVVTQTDFKMPSCSSTSLLAYGTQLDIRSHGSPVLLRETHTVVGVNVCDDNANCQNAAVPMATIVEELTPKRLVPANGIASGVVPVVATYRDPTKTYQK